MPLEVSAVGQVIETEMLYLGGTVNPRYLYSAKILDNLSFYFCVYLADTLKSAKLS